MKKILILTLSLILLLLLPGKDIENSDKVNSIFNLNSNKVVEINSFDQLPLTAGTLENKDLIGIVRYTPSDFGKYNVEITYLNTLYKMNAPVELPGVKDMEKAPIPNGYYFTDKSQRFMYYEFQNSASDKNLDSIFTSGYDEAVGFRPYVVWNTTSGKYEMTTKLKVMGVVNKGSNFRAYVDVLFNLKLDDLISIEFDYQYRQRYKPFGLIPMPWTQWKRPETVTRYKDEVVNTTSYWGYVKQGMDFKFWKPFTGTYNALAKKDFDSTISEIDKRTLTTNYKDDYTKRINEKLKNENKNLVTSRELFDNDFSMYSVYLDTFDNGMYNDYQIHDDIAVINLMYIYEGVLYHVPIDDIDFTGSGSTDNSILDIQYLLELLERLKMWFSKNTKYVLLVVLGIIGLILLSPVISIFKLIFSVIKMVFKLPGKIINLIKWLLIPKKKK